MSKRMLEGLALASTPSTIREVQQITGKVTTYVVECVKHDELGVFAFIEMVDEQGVTRMALTPKVVAELNRQQEALTARARSTAAKALAKQRKDVGILPGSMKRK
jgi:hypothetical protein